jgi:hypothetical protein
MDSLFKVSLLTTSRIMKHPRCTADNGMGSHLNANAKMYQNFVAQNGLGSDIVAQNAALGPHPYIPEDVPELPKVPRPHG